MLIHPPLPSKSAQIQKFNFYNLNNHTHYLLIFRPFYAYERHPHPTPTSKYFPLRYLFSVPLGLLVSIISILTVTVHETENLKKGTFWSRPYLQHKMFTMRRVTVVDVVEVKGSCQVSSLLRHSFCITTRGSQPFKISHQKHRWRLSPHWSSFNFLFRTQIQLNIASGENKKLWSWRDRAMMQ